MNYKDMEKELMTIYEHGMAEQEITEFMKNDPSYWTPLDNMKAYVQIKFLLKQREKMLAKLQELEQGDEFEPIRRRFVKK